MDQYSNASSHNPFKGPKSYDFGEYKNFYGREQDIVELNNLLRNDRLCILFARSGTGKSSLLKAGLIPHLIDKTNFLPVYIHLNWKAVSASSAKDFIEYVIKCYREEIDKRLSNTSYSLEEDKLVHPNSLFEFLHRTRIYQVASPSPELPTEKYLAKPVLIFDQFEEIFTLPLNPDWLNALLYELRCLLEDEMPSYLSEKLSDEHPAYQQLANSLMNKQKNFRVVFSFREEFLPQIESLRREIPSIRFTNNRYRLEPFSEETASEVIVKTAPAISKEIAVLVAQNLAIKTSNNFNHTSVEPFLLSLVCQKMYVELIGRDGAGLFSDLPNNIKELVNNAIDRHIKDVYKGISSSTKSFIEMKLITSDSKRTTYNYDDAAKDADLKIEIDKLTEDPDLRLLNKEEFLDSIHIEILHDRLVPPLAKKRINRLRKIEEDALLKQKRDFEKENEAKKRAVELEIKLKREKHQAQIRRRRFKINAFLTFIALIIAMLITISFQINRRKLQKEQSAAQLEKSNQALKTTLDSLTWQAELITETKHSLERQYAMLKMQTTTNDSLRNHLRQKNITLESSNSIISATVDSLEQVRQRLETESSNLTKTSNDKSRMIELFVSQTAALIKRYEKSNPFIALSMAEANYNEVLNLKTADRSLIQEYANRLLQTFNENDFFIHYKRSYKFSSAISTENAVGAIVVDTVDRNELNVFELNDPDAPPFIIVNYFKERDSRYGIPSDGDRLLQYGFTTAGDFFFTVLQIQGMITCNFWSLANGTINRKLKYSFAVSNFSNEFNRFTMFRGENDLAFSKVEKKSIDLIFFDSRRQQLITAKYKPAFSNERLVTLSQTGQLLTKRVGFLKTYNSEYRLYRPGNSSGTRILKNNPEQIRDARFFGDTLLVLKSISDKVTLELLDGQGKIIDSVDIKGKVELDNIVLDRGRILYSTDYYFVMSEKVQGNWVTNTYQIPHQDYVGRRGFSISHDGQQVCYRHGNSSIAVLNMTDGRLLCDIKLPENVTAKPFFSADDTNVILVNYSDVYLIYHRKGGKKVRSIEELREELKRNYQSVWPLSLGNKADPL